MRSNFVVFLLLLLFLFSLLLGYLMLIVSEMKFKFTRNLSKRVIYSFKAFVCLVPSKCLKLTFLIYIYAWYYLFIIKPRVEHIQQLEFISLELFKLNYIKKKNSIKTRFKLSTIKKEPLNIYLSETYSAQINLLAFFGFPLLQTFYELSEFKY